MNKLEVLTEAMNDNMNKSLKKYKFLVSDIDQTLTNDNDKIPEDLLNKLKEVKDKVCLATGRDYDLAYNIATEIGCRYIITSNGCLLKDLKEDKFLYIDYLNDLERDNLFKIIEKYPCLVTLETPERIYHSLFNMDVDESETKTFIRNTESYKRFNKIIFKKDLFDFVKTNDIKVMTLRISLPQYNHSLIQELNELNLRNMYTKINTIGDPQLGASQDIINLNIQSNTNDAKINAVRKLVDTLGINMEDVIACGNGLNDVHLLKNVGLGIAVRNAHPELFDVSDRITNKDNNSSAVLDIINSYLL